jgi:hypothetical protein
MITHALIFPPVAGAAALLETRGLRCFALPVAVATGEFPKYRLGVVLFMFMELIRAFLFKFLVDKRLMQKRSQRTSRVSKSYVEIGPL